MFHYSLHDIDQFLEKLTYDRSGRVDGDWFKDWCEPVQPIKLWEKSKCPIEDFFVIEDYQLIVHTVVGSNYVYLSESTHDGVSQIVAILDKHECDLCPTFHYMAESTILITGDKHSQLSRPSSLFLWNLSSVLVREHSVNSPWRLCSPSLIVPNAHSCSITCLSFAPESGSLVSASSDSTFKCWTYTRGEVL